MGEPLSGTSRGGRGAATDRSARTAPTDCDARAGERGPVRWSDEQRTNRQGQIAVTGGTGQKGLLKALGRGRRVA